MADQDFSAFIDSLTAGIGAPKQPKAPSGPTMPGAIAIQPLTSTSQIRPLTPGYDPSVAIDALQDVVRAQKGAIGASADAIAKNTVIQQNVLSETERLQMDQIEALDNLQRIQNYGGVNPLTKIIGMFDDRFNAGVQQTRIQKDEIKTQQVQMRAQAQMQINAQLPALKQAEAQLAAQDFENQMKVVDITTKFRGLEQKDIELRISETNLLINLSQEQRAQVTQAASALGINEARQALKDARAGKGQWVGMEGILEAKINNEDKTLLEMQNIRLAIREKNETLRDKSEARLSSLIPVATAEALVTNAISTNSPFITLGQGKDAVQLPTALVQAKLKENKEVQTAIETSILHDNLTQVNDRMLGAVNKAAALSVVDSGSARQNGIILQAYQQLNPQDPNSVRQFGQVIDGAHKVLDERIKVVAAGYKTADAKNAIEQFGKDGKFSVTGAQSVVQETVGNMGVAATSKFQGAWQTLNMEFAGLIKQQNLKGAPPFDPDNPNLAQSASFLAWALTQGQAQQKMDTMRELVMTDPLVRTKVADQIGGVVQTDNVIGALRDLSTAPNADPIWKKILDQRQNTMETNRSFDRRKLITYMEQQKAMQGPNAPDYSAALTDAIRARVVSGAQTGQTDPTYTIHDRALQTQVFGDSPDQAIMSTFMGNWQADVAARKEAMQKAIDQDVSGQTQRMSFGAPPDPMSGTTRNPIELIQTAPSATGIPGMSADKMKSLYSGGR